MGQTTGSAKRYFSLSACVIAIALDSSPNTCTTSKNDANSRSIIMCRVKTTFERGVFTLFPLKDDENHTSQHLHFLEQFVNIYIIQYKIKCNSITEYIPYYNQVRLKEYLGWMSPEEFLKANSAGTELMIV